MTDRIGPYARRTAFAAYIGILWSATPAWLFFGFVGALVIAEAPPETAEAAFRTLVDESLMLALKLYLPATVLAWLMLWQIDRGCGGDA